MTEKLSHADCFLDDSAVSCTVAGHGYADDCLEELRQQRDELYASLEAAVAATEAGPVHFFVPDGATAEPTDDEIGAIMRYDDRRSRPVVYTPPWLDAAKAALARVRGEKP